MIDRYLLSAAEENERLDEEFAQRVCELLIEEWNPEKFDNVIQAIAEDVLVPYRDCLEYSILNNDFAEYGRIIFKAVEEYCIHQAEDQANFEFSRGLN
jgi:hypothetical protein